MIWRRCPKIVFACFSSLDDLTLSLLHAQPAAARPAIPWAKAELFWVEPAPGSLLRFPTERIAHDNRCTAGFRCDLMSALGPILLQKSPMRAASCAGVQLEPWPTTRSVGSDGLKRLRWRRQRGCNAT